MKSLFLLALTLSAICLNSQASGSSENPSWQWSADFFSRVIDRHPRVLIDQLSIQGEASPLVTIHEAFRVHPSAQVDPKNYEFSPTTEVHYGEFGVEPYDQDNPRKIKLHLEKVPPLVATLRGCVTYDCSMQQVPHYSLLQDTEVFWIRTRKSLNRPPRGYVLVTLVEAGGETLPYIITINGNTLGYTETKAAIALIAKAYGTDKVIVPDFKHSATVVNDETKKFAMEGRTPIQVQFNDSWVNYDLNFGEKPNPFYSIEKLKNALILPTNQLSVSPHPGSYQFSEMEQTYKPIPIEGHSQLSRALLAAEIIRQIDDKDHIMPIKEYFKLGNKAINAARSLLNLPPRRGLDHQKLRQYAEDLNLDPLELLSRLNRYSQARSFVEIINKERQLEEAQPTRTYGMEHLVKDYDFEYRYDMEELLTRAQKLSQWFKGEFFRLVDIKIDSGTLTRHVREMSLFHHRLTISDSDFRNRLAQPENFKYLKQYVIRLPDGKDSDDTEENLRANWNYTTEEWQVVISRWEKALQNPTENYDYLFKRASLQTHIPRATAIALGRFALRTDLDPKFKSLLLNLLEKHTGPDAIIEADCQSILSNAAARLKR